MNADKDEQGKFEQKSIFSHLKLYAMYLMEHDKLKNIYIKNKDIKQFTEDRSLFLDLATSNKEKLPLFFGFIATPLHWWHKKQDSFMLWFYDKIDFFQRNGKIYLNKKSFSQVFYLEFCLFLPLFTLCLSVL